MKVINFLKRQKNLKNYSTTHFGFKEVEENEKQKLVSGFFFKNSQTRCFP
jgi:hypothetical protein